ncbi:MAG: ATP-binding protein [Candidatus Eremiobacterota bacterium]
MTDEELEALLSDLESDRCERTSSERDKDKLRKAICAFANDLPNHQQPGVLFIGVHDDGACAHVAIDDRVLTSLGEFKYEGKILPLPSLEVSKRRLRGCEMAVVVVHPSLSPPVRVDGQTWIRVGPRKGLATPDEERRLSEKRRAGDLPFDLQPVTGAGLEDLDLNRFATEYLPCAVHPDVLEENERERLHQLQSLRFVNRLEPPVPTVKGLLIAGKSPRDWIPGAYVQFVRFEGTEWDTPIQTSREVSGTLADQLRQVEELVRAHVSVSLDLTGPVEVKKPDYPEQALRQLIANAVLHRNYETSNSPVRFYWFQDRVEIFNPGGPFGEVTCANFGQPHVTGYRNPHLAEALRHLGFVQQFGVGIALARRALRENGNPELEFTVQDSSVLATVRPRP